MTARDIRSSELLRLAASLAGQGAGRGRPRTVELRRSVSTSYYALFHELTTHCMERAFGSGPADAARRHNVGRWIQHGDVRVLAQAVNGSGNAELIRALEPAAPDLLVVASAFTDLMTARHDADYRHDYLIDKRTALLNVTLAGDAVSRLRALRAGGDDSYARFLSLMLGGVKIARKR